jgi:hypothetical protein
VKFLVFSRRNKRFFLKKEAKTSVRLLRSGGAGRQLKSHDPVAGPGEANQTLRQHDGSDDSRLRWPAAQGRQRVFN